MKIKIGKAQGKNFEIDADILADTRAIVCASSGAGKSYLLRGIVENVGEKIQTIIFDPEGEFSTLREELDILVVGENGDLQADIKSAKLLARKIAETGVSVVIDLYDLPGAGDPWDKRRFFVAEFITALMNLPKSIYHPMLVIVDEAHQFAPESKGGEAATASRSAINSLMSAGRKRGIGGILATQRISKIHKDSIADARNVFIGGTTLDIDQERAGDMLGMNKKDSVGLRDLAPGEFYCYGPATGARGVFKFQSNPVKTTHPKAGQRSSIVVPKASSHIADIATQFGDLPTQAQQELDTMEFLKKENSRLARELSARPVQIKPETKIQVVEVPVIKAEDLEGLANIVLAFNKIGGHFSEEVSTLQSILKDAKMNEMTDRVKNLPREIFENVKIGAVNSILTQPYKPGVPTQVSKLRIIPDEPGEKLPKAEKAILNVLAQYDHRSTVQIALLAGYAVGTGAFNNAMGSLRTKKYIWGTKDSISITEEGLSALGPFEPLPTGWELINYWKKKLGKAERSVLEVLVKFYPAFTSKEFVAQEAGYTPGTGSINNAFGRMKTLELMIVESGEVRLNATIGDSLL